MRRLLRRQTPLILEDKFLPFSQQQTSRISLKKAKKRFKSRD
jgi:hypothetical protein